MKMEWLIFEFHQGTASGVARWRGVMLPDMDGMLTVNTETTANEWEALDLAREMMPDNERTLAAIRATEFHIE